METSLKERHMKWSARLDMELRSKGRGKQTKEEGGISKSGKAVRATYLNQTLYFLNLLETQTNLSNSLREII